MEIRRSLVPWISTSEDLDEGRRFCWSIDYSPSDMALCLPISHTEPTEQDRYLILHATLPDALSCALSSTPRYDPAR